MTERFLECMPWPDGTPITQEFGDTYSGYAHRGRDAGTPTGTPIVPGAPGVAVDFLNSWTTWNGQSVRSFGNAVCIDFGNGLFGLYAHLSRVDVSIGEHVTARQIIGLSGNTGVSSGPHLHQQLCVDTRFSTDISQSRDPRDYILEEDDMTTDEVNALIEKFVGIAFPAYIEAYFGGGFSARNGMVSDLNPEGKGPIRPWIKDIAERVRTIPGMASDG